MLTTTYDDESDVWHKSNLMEDEQSNFPALVIPFSNEPQANKKTLPVQGMRARLTYYQNDGVKDFKRIDSGCWLGNAYGTASLEVGGIVYLIAAVSIGGRWGVVENPRHSVGRYSEDRTSVDPLPEGTYELKVRLVGGDHGEYSETFWFQLEVGEQPKLCRVNQQPM